MSINGTNNTSTTPSSGPPISGILARFEKLAQQVNAINNSVRANPPSTENSYRETSSTQHINLTGSEETTAMYPVHRGVQYIDLTR